MDIDRYRVRHGSRSALKRISPSETGPFPSKQSVGAALSAGLKRLDKLQERLYASDRYALLLIFQGMDAAGKDSAISHVLSGVNPQGTEVQAFKPPSDEELAHDFLWRAARALPARGRIGIFNRSYYEDVVTVRVHPELVAKRRLPADRVSSHLWRERFADIEAFERHLDRSGTVVRKFFLHVSRAKQRERLLNRLDDPGKRWKFSMSDLKEREKWPKHQAAYGEAIAATSHKHAPWYVIPADHKWFAHALIAEVLVQTLQELDMSLPTGPIRGPREMARARRLLAR
jgi:PPK2 family polyphosphate:nucleotide phosphotransferase